MTHNGFFQDRYGNYSSSRLLGFIVVICALVLTTTVLILGYISGASMILVATAMGTTFTSIAGPALVYMFGNKQSENAYTQLQPE